MDLNEASLHFLEEHIPELAEAATKQAYWAALATGSSVLICENATLVEVHPDGTRQIIKKLPPQVRVTKGLKVKIQ